MDEGRRRAVNKAFTRFVGELAYASSVAADSEEAYRLAFFLTAGAFQSRSKQNCVQVLNDEIRRVVAANPPRPAASVPTVEVASMDDVPEPERTALLQKFREEMRAQGKTDEEIVKLEASAREFEKANKGRQVAAP